MVVTLENNNVIKVGPLKIKLKPNESVIVAGFSFKGNHIIKYGNVIRREEEEASFSVTGCSLNRWKYCISG